MRRLSLALCGLAFLALSTGCDSSGTTGTVRVMSQNLYLGADLFLVANEQDPNMIPVRVAQLYGSVQASDPAARMAAVAAEIARVNPDLVGLQEVTTYYVQSPGDNLPGAANTTATTVTFDFLQLLLDALGGGRRKGNGFGSGLGQGVIHRRNSIHGGVDQRARARSSTITAQWDFSGAVSSALRTSKSHGRCKLETSAPVICSANHCPAASVTGHPTPR